MQRSMPQTAPYGAWRSSISAAAIAAGGVSLSSVSVDGDDLYWLEGRPLEAGRAVLVRHSADGTRTDLTPSPMSVRTRVHEYGGGAYTVANGTVYFTNFADQRLYRQDRDGQPRPITPEPPVAAGVRYADFVLARENSTLIAVRERHASEGPEATNELVALPADGSGEARILAGGHDFYSTPRVSPDGRHLSWLVWDHPRMPWDGTELWVADLDSDGSLRNERRVAGGPTESIFQPTWSPGGELHFASDRTGWWNLYRLVSQGEAVPLAPLDAEFGAPQWVFGMRQYCFLDERRIATVYSRDGLEHLAVLDEGTPLLTLDLPYTAFERCLTSLGDSSLAVIAASPTQPASVVRLDPLTGDVEVLRRARQETPDAATISQPRSIAFPTENGSATAYGLYYPPRNPDFVAPETEKPPVIVISHGGPTAMTQAAFSLAIQYWTSRGFAVVDVNYGGSAGYGRPYRERLKGRWGIVDTEDCIQAARYLAAQGEVDPRRFVIRGGSAGGYTTLCALVFHDDFAAGASYYGVADCEALATDTHKFESRYLDGLIGPYPEARAVYYQRSPIHFADRLSCPVILFQGLEDRVVPPSQAERMVEALQAKHLPYAYLAFEGEQHGFRKAATLTRTLEAELYFYSRVFRFPLADAIEPVTIANLADN